MEFAKHCQFCTHQKRDFQTGTTCGLTEEKPYFNTRCPNINFNKQVENQIEELNVDLELVKFKKGAAIFHAIVFGCIAALIIVSGILIGVFVWEAGFIATVPLLIVSSGLGLVPFAIAPLNKFRNELGVAKRRKEEMDEILTGYKVKYESKISISKDIHGNLDVVANTSII